MTQQGDTGGGAAIYPPSEAARLIGVSTPSLRRYAATLEALHGDLPRDPQGRRLWTGGAVARLQAARELLTEGRAASLEAALEQLSGEPLDTEVTLDATPSPAQGEALRRLHEALDTVARLEQQNGELLGEIRGLRAQLADQGSTEALTAALEHMAELNRQLLAERETRRSAPAQGVLNPLTRLYRWLYQKDSET